MRRNTLLLFVGAVVALAVACRDSAVAPARSATSLSASAAPSLSSSASNANRTLLGSIELSPNGGTYHVGDFDVIMPAAAVCEPAVTKYGPRHWDDDCVAARRTITVNVIAKTNGSKVSVDFQPDLRFRPSAGWVVIQTSAYRELLTTQSVRQLSPSSSYFNNFAILYVPTGGKAQIDERRSTGDGSLVTHVDLRSGLVWRRVKHFSGFLVSLGFKCDETTADNSCPVDDGLGGAGAAGSASISSFTFGVPLVFSSVVVTPNDSTSDQQ
jgi:hypothetical protein